ncbi:hypothetical protein LJC54_01965 [Parabacteroides sp. OttesenSCG-928-J18]|nr:hypothetical protein [Parabacteroides sp. OttesenSCG-928-J18]
MITKQEFELATKEIFSNFSAALPKMTSYKSYVQLAILDIATQQEMEDVRDCHINQSMINKLARLAKGKWMLIGDAQSLFCAAMAVATIVKEYDWGTYYLKDNGLFEMANLIQNA